MEKSTHSARQQHPLQPPQKGNQMFRDAKCAEAQLGFAEALTATMWPLAFLLCEQCH